ncbi:LOW QUALITY PROTEIN: pentatricopeptide repeat-containing protein At3g22470, mitochondrial-like [Benincasa hispida]|uniref:LOW QUALITY PROTEIN: pentatricopeptide repeat-containing protein At3g22470, mitochondrial-like n=1 Tax=Benincasa hispida TaxID=102211 RepID=UPI001901C94D|nr:LOW QUALITY PROTEIN: pentatricopeptide repeat-containing protein At3g22470, mitochondrial-like [Benincasa hispida]
MVGKTLPISSKNPNSNQNMASKSVASASSIVSVSSKGLLFQRRLHTFLQNCRTGKITPTEALHFFDLMMHSSPTPPFRLYMPDVVTYGTLIKELCRTGNVNIALKLHQEMLNDTGQYGINCKPNVICYHIIIDGLCKFCCSGNWKEAKRLLNEMVDQGVQPNVVTFNVLIDMFCKAGKVIKAKELLELMTHRGTLPDLFTYNSLIEGFCLVGDLNGANELFVSMPSKGCEPDVISYTVLINGYCKSLKVEEAMKLYNGMLQVGKRPDVKTYGALLTGLFLAGKVGDAKKLFGVIKAYGIPEAGKLETAWEQFEKLSQEGLQPDVVTYSIMIHGFCKGGQVDKANILFQKMKENGCTPNIITYSTLLCGFCESNKSDEVVQQMVQKDVLPEAGICTIVVDMVCKDEKYQECLDLLRKFPIQKRQR